MAAKNPLHTGQRTTLPSLTLYGLLRGPDTEELDSGPGFSFAAGGVFQGAKGLEVETRAPSIGRTVTPEPEVRFRADAQKLRAPTAEDVSRLMNEDAPSRAALDVEQALGGGGEKPRGGGR